jgi:hypothetical protein
MPKFIRTHIRKFGNKISKDFCSQQALKLCVSCKLPFSSKNGRKKSYPVENTIGSFICEKCSAKILSGEKLEGISVCASNQL